MRECNPTKPRPPKKVGCDTHKNEAVASVKIKGYKKFRKRVRRLQEDTKQLNRELEKAVELKEKLF